MVVEAEVKELSEVTVVETLRLPGGDALATAAACVCVGGRVLTKLTCEGGGGARGHGRVGGDAGGTTLAAVVAAGCVSAVRLTKDLVTDRDGDACKEGDKSVEGDGGGGWPWLLLSLVSVSVQAD